MTTEHRARGKRWMMVGVPIAATSFALVLSVLVASGDEKAETVVPADRTTIIESSAAIEPAATAPTSPPSVGADVPGEDVHGPATTRPTSPPSVGTDVHGRDVHGPAATSIGEGQEPLGSTEDCRADPRCPSSEHRTSDPCGAGIIADTAGYLEGRHDAEGGLPHQIDQAPAPGPADDDDDDATVGPETLYRAGYIQGWCDGGGAPAS